MLHQHLRAVTMTQGPVCILRDKPVHRTPLQLHRGIAYRPFSAGWR